MCVVDKRLKLAFYVSLVVGLVVFATGIVFIPRWWGSPWWRHGGAVWLSSFAVSLMISSGALIMVSAVFLYTNPQHHMIFGLLILLASPLALIALGILSLGPWITEGLMIILMLTGMMAGALAVTYRCVEERSSPSNNE
jgi:hypothetical protein